MHGLTIHLGAHRTASSSVQTGLLELETNGGLPGWRVFEPSQIRSRLIQAVRVGALVPAIAHPLTTRLMVPEFAAALRKQDTAVLASDESFLGKVDDCFAADEGLYPHANRNLRAVKGLFSVARPQRVVLSVRDYATWWPSAHALLSTRQDMPKSHMLVSSWMQAQRRWPDVVSDVLVHFGACDVVCYEALSVDPKALAKALVGEAGEAIRKFRFQRSLTEQGIEAMKAAYATNAAPDAETVKEIRREDRARARPSPFTDEQCVELSARYHQDLNHIAASGATIIAPPPDWRAA